VEGEEHKKQVHIGFGFFLWYEADVRDTRSGNSSCVFLFLLLNYQLKDDCVRILLLDPNKYENLLKYLWKSPFR
jgi:hypothetical protein